MLVRDMGLSPQLSQYHLRRKYYIFVMGNRCVKCRSVRDLEFDHVDPSSKLYTITEMLAQSLSEELLHAELQKCQLLCRDCHQAKSLSEQGAAAHGTGGMYRHHGCRCELCKAANREYSRNFAARQKAKRETGD